jgi:predicted MPP superfamily phosphohydrolase
MSPEIPSKGRAKAGSGLTRRRFLKAAVAGGVAGTTAAAYARYVEPTWVEVTQNDLPVPSLPPAWEGARIAHLSDFHLCPWVPEAYLARCIKQTSDLKPDLVVVTGDFITIGSEEYGPRAARLLTDLNSPFGTFACLGNHEYGLGRPNPQPVRPSPVTGALEDAGVRVLNNASKRITREGGDLWIAGVEDLWSARYDPARAMADVPSGAANLVLCHNPDAAEAVADAGGGAILAGHTHGGQVQIPLLGPPILPVRNKQRYEGLHRVGGTWLYINRGLGWLWRVRFACRPEISLLTLRQAGRNGADLT